MAQAAPRLHPLPAMPSGPVPFGVEVQGWDLSQVTPEDHAALEALLQEHVLLLFRRQSLTDPEIEHLSGLFGPVEIDGNENAHSRHTPHVTYMSNLQDETGRVIGGLGNGEVMWHSDQTFRAAPATLAALYAVEVPLQGGSTWWCNTQLGYDALPPALQQRIEGLEARYMPGTIHTIDKVQVLHPLVLTHPLTGRKSLYVSQQTQWIEGMPQAEGLALVRDLLEYQLRPQHLYAHAWRPGDIVIYDNGRTLHRRDPFQGNRLMKATRVFLPAQRFPVPAGRVAPEQVTGLDFDASRLPVPAVPPPA